MSEPEGWGLRKLLALLEDVAISTLAQHTAAAEVVVRDRVTSLSADERDALLEIGFRVMPAIDGVREALRRRFEDLRPSSLRLVREEASDDGNAQTQDIALEEARDAVRRVLSLVEQAVEGSQSEDRIEPAIRAMLLSLPTDRAEAWRLHRAAYTLAYEVDLVLLTLLPPPPQEAG